VALGGRGFVSVGAVVVCCALAAACTSEPSSISTPVPTSAATTPTESQIERQERLDYEAAEEAYRASTLEQDRIYRAGGATKASPALKATTTGSYLRITLESLREVHKSGWHAKGHTEIVGVVRDGGWRPDQVGLTSCEDNSAVRFLDRTGDDVTPNVERRYVQKLTVVRVNERWKVSTASSTRVHSFEGQPCVA
jgi:hypothetical protein